ncbi:11704_t:CDS:2 [Funneliformis mosseae]|uniref:11704_t:CDS:1 n=1 Tax=Funneliformis mosseae TaxID=27381 RepID=A0A9N9B6C9_FUNMO|nr:11704_t:CDS:2 [Funneliformis mosseae]
MCFDDILMTKLIHVLAIIVVVMLLRIIFQNITFISSISRGDTYLGKLTRYLAETRLRINYFKLLRWKIPSEVIISEVGNPIFGFLVFVGVDGIPPDSSRGVAIGSSKSLIVKSKKRLVLSSSYEYYDMVEEILNVCIKNMENDCIRVNEINKN